MQSRRLSSCRQAVVFAILTVAASTAVPGVPAQAAPSYTIEERAFAIAGPSLVYLETKATVYLRRKDTGELLDTSPSVISNRCSGFAVTSQGHAISSTACVKPPIDAIHRTAAQKYAAEEVGAHRVEAAQQASFAASIMEVTDLTGSTPGSPISEVIYGQLYGGTPKLAAEPAMEVTVAASLALDEGGVTLVKFPKSIPVAELSTEQVTPSSPVVIIGLSGGDRNEIYVPKYAATRVVGTYGTKQPAQYQMDGDIGEASTGGIVADSGGRILGMIGPDQHKVNRVIIPQEHLRTVLSQAQAANSLSEMDSAYRAGLNAYFGGRYTEAISKLDTVLALNGSHPSAGAYRKLAQERLAVEGDSSASSGLPGWVISLLIGLAFALLAGGAYVVAMGMRRRSAAPEPGFSPYAPDYSAPISAMPDYPRQPVSGAGYSDYDYMTALRDQQSYYGQAPALAEPPVSPAPPPVSRPQPPLPGATPSNPWEPPAQQTK
jgi:hypothetical protein